MRVTVKRNVVVSPGAPSGCADASALMLRVGAVPLIIFSAVTLMASTLTRSFCPFIVPRKRIRTSELPIKLVRSMLSWVQRFSVSILPRKVRLSCVQDSPLSLEISNATNSPSSKLR